MTTKQQQRLPTKNEMAGAGETRAVDAAR